MKAAGATTRGESGETVRGFVRRMRLSDEEHRRDKLPLEFVRCGSMKPAFHCEVAFGLFHLDGAPTGSEIVVRWYTRDGDGRAWPLIRVTPSGFNLIRELAGIIRELAGRADYQPQEVVALLTREGFADLGVADSEKK